VTATRSDLAALQGSWEQVAFERDGSPDLPDDYGAPGLLTTFHRNHFSVRAADGAVLLEGEFELDAPSIPKTVDWIDATGADAGKRLLAIYKLEDDVFVFIAADADAPRPTQFRTGPGQVMRSFVRRG
jgi:uncharacterized protein (TIGR03067 family)